MIKKYLKSVAKVLKYKGAKNYNSINKT